MQGMSKVAKMAWSGALAPSFVNKGFVTAEITDSIVHTRHKALTGPQATGGVEAHVSFTWTALADQVTVMFWLVLRLLGQPGENSVSAVPMATPVFLQALSFLPAYPGFKISAHSVTERDNWRSWQDQETKYYISYPPTLLW